MSSFVMATCPACKQLQPHTTEGVQKDHSGREYQTMVCNVCKTSSQVFTGEEGKDFQSNYDAPDNTDLSKI